MNKIMIMMISSILLPLFLLACTSPSSSQMMTPKPDLSRYMPEEVVDLVKTILTKDANNPQLISLVQNQKGMAQYKGNGLWFVELGVYTSQELIEELFSYARRNSDDYYEKVRKAWSYPATAEYKGDGEWLVKFSKGSEVYLFIYRVTVYQFNFRESTETVTAINSMASAIMGGLKAIPRR